MYTPPVTPPCSSTGITCRYELSFEIRLSVSKSPFGSDSCSLSAANVLTVCVAVRICDVAIAAAIAMPSKRARFILPFCNTMGTVAQENPFSITLAFPHLDTPGFPRALELARQSSGFRQTGEGTRARYQVQFRVDEAGRLLDVFNVVRERSDTEIR